MTRTLTPSWLQLRRRLAPWVALWDDLIGAWRLAIARQPDALDDAALRDLGISRSELQSYIAEADGLVESTRRRVIEHRALL
ncbi:MAG TPA: hypothetical protein VFU71_17335 [Burkholderiaceae bacterium]|nr:hypothetical protein [Burkholderiaceae bacterium]